MISEYFYDMIGIKYDLKTFRGRFLGITKSGPVGMPLNTDTLEQKSLCAAKFLNPWGAYRDEAVQFPTCVFIYVAFPDISYIFSSWKHLSVSVLRLIFQYFFRSDHSSFTRVCM